MDPLVSTAEFGVWLGQTLAGTDEERAEAILTAVSSLVRSEAGLTWEDEAVPDDIAGVVLEVASGIYHNPRAVKQTSVGDVSATFAVVSGLSLTQAQKAIIGRYRAQSRGLWTQGFTRNDLGADTVYIPVEGAPPIPWYDGSDV